MSSVGGHADTAVVLHAQGLSGFVGQACRRYDRMDTSAICQYLANTLKAAQSYDLLVLKALLSDMTVSHPTHSSRIPLMHFRLLEVLPAAGRTRCNSPHFTPHWLLG